MPTFSERYGYTAVRTALQHEEMDQRLRTDLWNAISIVVSQAAEQVYHPSDYPPYFHIWVSLWHRPIDEVPWEMVDMGALVKRHVQTAEWYEVYDLIESFVVSVSEDEDDEYEELFNMMLERNLAAWRFVERTLVRFDEETDIEAIEQAMADTTNIAGAKHHLRNAVALLSNREKPDYANSIKESISAVEAVGKHLSGKKKAMLPDGLRALKDRGVTIHPALERSWIAAYGYTSDSGGIRHAMSDDNSVDRADALYFLVTSSAFISLLLNRAASAGLLALQGSDD